MPVLHTDSDIILGVQWLRAHSIQIIWATNRAESRGLLLGPPVAQRGEGLSVSAALTLHGDAEVNMVRP